MKNLKEKKNFFFLSSHATQHKEKIILKFYYIL